MWHSRSPAFELVVLFRCAASSRGKLLQYSRHSSTIEGLYKLLRRCQVLLAVLGCVWTGAGLKSAASIFRTAYCWLSLLLYAGSAHVISFMSVALFYTAEPAFIAVALAVESADFDHGLTVVTTSSCSLGFQAALPALLAIALLAGHV